LRNSVSQSAKGSSVNEVGNLAAGASRSTGVLTVARVCRFHDHKNEQDAAFKERIIVQ